MLRYLTTDAKLGVMAEWEKTKVMPCPDGDLGGRGFPDPEIIPLCDTLNMLPGICTLQSCAGHIGGERERPNGETGLLWLWLDFATSQVLDCFTHVADRLPGIESVSRRYTDWGQEIVVIEFSGDFERACESVIIFFTAAVYLQYNRAPTPR